MSYRRPVNEVLSSLATDANRGLSSADARARLGRYGLNELETEKGPPAWKRFLAQFKNALVMLLLVATAISAGMWFVERETALPFETHDPGPSRDRAGRRPDASQVLVHVGGAQTVGRNEGVDVGSVRFHAGDRSDFHSADASWRRPKLDTIGLNNDSDLERDLGRRVVESAPDCAR